MVTTPSATSPGPPQLVHQRARAQSYHPSAHSVTRRRHLHLLRNSSPALLRTFESTTTPCKLSSTAYVPANTSATTTTLYAASPQPRRRTPIAVESGSLLSTIQPHWIPPQGPPTEILRNYRVKASMPKSPNLWAALTLLSIVFRNHCQSLTHCS